MQYTAEQQNFISHNVEKNDVSLIACPGSGKSTCVLQRINFIGKQKGLNRSLILSYSKLQCEDLKIKKKRMNIKGIDMHMIMTIHSLCGRLYSKQGNGTISSQKTIIVAINRKLTQQTLDCSYLQHIDYIFVDEAQDLSQIQYDTIMKLAKTIDACVIMIGDPNQNIYQFQGSKSEYLINHSKTQFYLTTNTRSSHNIVMFQKDLMQFPIGMNSLMNGTNNKVEINTLDRNDTLQHITKMILESGIPFENIAVTGPCKTEMQSRQQVKVLGLQSVCNWFSEHQIPFNQRYVVSNNNNDSCISSINPGHVNILTLHGSKGLEFELVIMIDFHLKTYKRLPSEEAYDQFKNLWFVGVSRAKTQLIVYRTPTMRIWPEIFKCNSSLYNSNIQLQEQPLTLQKSPEIKNYVSVTDLLKSQQYLSDENSYDLVEMLGIQSKLVFENQVVDPNIIKQLDPSLMTLWGIFAENIYQYLTHKRLNNESVFIQQLEQQFYLYKFIDIQYQQVYKLLMQHQQIDIVGISVNRIKEILGNKCNEHKQFIETVSQLVDNDNQDILLVVASSNISYDPVVFTQLISNLEHGGFLELFETVLYLYQIQNQAKYLLNRDFSEYLQMMELYIVQIESLIDKQSCNSKFQVQKTHPDIYIYGVIDILSDSCITELKFSQSLQLDHILQVFIYSLLDSPNAFSSKTLKIVNIATCQIHEVSFNKEVSYVKLLMFLADITKFKLRNRVFIYDLETTGLEHTSDIIQRHCVDFSTNSVASSGYIKHEVPLNIQTLTGITQETVNNGDPSYDSIRNDFQLIRRVCLDPILIAHNGKRFDHRLMQSRGIIQQYDFTLLDSMQIIRACCDQLSCLKLVDVHYQICGTHLEGAHNACVDVQMLYNIFNQLSLTCEDFQQMD